MQHDSYNLAHCRKWSFQSCRVLRDMQKKNVSERLLSDTPYVIFLISFEIFPHELAFWMGT